MDSTNLYVRRLAMSGAPTGTTLLAEEQTGGRGRLGREWFSPPRCGLWFSILLRPPALTALDASPLTLVTAAALTTVLNEKKGLPVKIKWPNDLVAVPGKVGGILAEVEQGEGMVRAIIVGVGINVNRPPQGFPPHLAEKAIALEDLAGQPLERRLLFGELHSALLEAYEKFFVEGFAPFQETWQRYSAITGRIIILSGPGGRITRGRARGVDSRGRLLLEDSAGREWAFNTGEITGERGH